MASRHPSLGRLRVPVALAVTVVGTTASLALAFVGCEEGIPEPIDGKILNNMREDSGHRDAREELADAVDAAHPSDARPADAPPDTPIV